MLSFVIVIAPRPQVEVRSRSELRRWLNTNHGRGESVWLVTYKKTSGASYLPYDAIVEEALAYGWIDSQPRSLDAQRSMRLLSPRHPGSAWSARNKAIVARLDAAGLMAASGQAAVERARRDGSWQKLDRVEALEVPPDLAEALAALPPAAANFAAFPRSSRRLILEWIGAARRPATRAARIADTASQAAQNLRAHHHRQPGRSADHEP